MRITKYNKRVVVSCSHAEFEILGIAVDQIEAGDPRDHLTSPGHRRSWGRRTYNGSFLRIDHDKQTDTEGL